ncbi:D-alanine--D-alanine ligase family protein [Marivirga arenosa]|uniref:D-alanine--D-alanine ligase n=1 Tax=Marivirga arenosa TaxID=3059076 RepID=A0AA51X496_9BACT|nr:D-alanine--D-alanine ligase [Marivirga sp. BKB1-2]WNB17165.1 D-alanine--D-alanine ligase [Marivirga sp. BKB1-2]
MKIGIFFGGQSREREISFAGGRTVYDNLNKSIFEAVPIFVDSKGHFILLDWQYIYKGTIRDFYPPVKYLPQSDLPVQIYAESLENLSENEWDKLISEVGKKLEPSEFKEYIDFAFLAMHGPYGEDGNIQGMLEWYGIPYSGAGILPSSIGISKIAQRQLLQQANFESPKSITLNKADWKSHDHSNIFESLQKELGLPLVIKAPHQGSSIGVSILSEDNLEDFEKLIQKSFFELEIHHSEWSSYAEDEKIKFIAKLVDIREGIGLPVIHNESIIYTPDDLLNTLNQKLSSNSESIKLQAIDSEDSLLIESFIEGKEFSCIVIQDENGKPIALPPTEIRKGKDVFDYRSKYLPGISRKITPINAPQDIIEKIRTKCANLFNALQIDVYARIDGFITEEGKVFLNDPNTTSGMLPSSFFFHQAAEIGLNPSQFLSYIIRTSLKARLKTGKHHFELQKMVKKLDTKLEGLKNEAQQKINVGVIMGGFSTERHISVESGRNIYEKLASSEKYLPIPIFLSGDESKHILHILPINIMLKDNADDIKDKIQHYEVHPIISQIKFECQDITDKYVSGGTNELKKIKYSDLNKLIDVAFIALHGRPGEDGAVQSELEKLNIPYNGSDVESSKITINKYDTNEILKKAGISVADHRLVFEDKWQSNKEAELSAIEGQLNYPLIAKPADDGCSSAVKKIKNRAELEAFAGMMFRPQAEFIESLAKTLNLKKNEEFPQKNFFLLEELIEKKDAKYFLEITGGLLTHLNHDGSVRYEIFEPSEALAGGEVLSLEEKFLAGEGQNITPARYTPKSEEYDKVAEQVKNTLKKTAEVLNITGYARIDAFVRVFDDLTAETIIIEVNSLPGMTPATCIFHQTAINGYKPYDFIDKILSFGTEKMKNQTIEK